MNFLSLDAKPKISYHAQTLSPLVSRHKAMSYGRMQDKEEQL